jgi:hypothetical protein
MRCDAARELQLGSKIGFHSRLERVDMWGWGSLAWSHSGGRGPEGRAGVWETEGSEAADGVAIGQLVCWLEG